MILERILCCECNPGKIFKNNITFKAHLKTKRHLNWVSTNDIKNLKINNKDNENNMLSYKLKYDNLDKKYKLLSIKYKKIDQLSQYYIKNFTIIIIFLIIKYSL